MAMRSINSADAKTWSAPDGAGNPLFQGPALTEFRGELWGAWVCSQEGYENVPYLYKYVDGKMPVWGGNFALNPKWRMIGRMSTTTLDDKYYLAYRANGSGKYWVAHSSNPKVSDGWKVINPQSVTALWAYSPTICAFQGSLVLLGVDEDKQIYFEVINAAGVIERAWTKIENAKTVRAPALCVFQNVLYMVFVSDQGNLVDYAKLTDKTGSWSGLQTLIANGVASSVSMAVHSDGQLYTSWTNNDGAMNFLYTADGNLWYLNVLNTTARAQGSSGVGSLGGKLYVAYGQKSATSTASAKFIDGEGVPMYGSDEDSDDETNEVYYEKQEAMQAYRPKWLAPAGNLLPSPSSGEELKPKTWRSKFFCL